MRWELSVNEDKVERMMGHGRRIVGKMYYDGLRKEIFAQTVAETETRYRAEE